MGGTPKALEDPVKGVFSYEALKSRLSAGRFTGHESVNLMAPIIRIQPLTKSELVILMEKIRDIHSDLYGYQSRVTTENIVYLINHIYSEIPINEITPRYIIRDFISILNVLYQNENETFDSVTIEFNFSNDIEENFDIEE